jgi:shikimate kinase
MNVILIGYRGSGKSTVARQLALRLGWPWLDADVEIELAAGKSIRAIFADDGEPAFRALEQEVIDRLCGRERIVMAAGGGAVLRAANRQRMRQAGKVVWLQADVETIVRRLAADTATAERRPALTAAGTAAEVAAVLRERTPLYRETADLELDTAGKSPSQVAQEILDWLPQPITEAG